MRKLARYLKPHILALTLCVVLMAIQALCSLQLPTYMSDIVNIGIQREGIAENSPKAITERGMMVIERFSGADDKKLLLDSYDFVTSGSDDGKSYESKYPAAKEQNIFVQKDLGKEDQEKVDVVYRNAMASIPVLANELGKGNKTSDEGSQFNSNSYTTTVDDLYAFASASRYLPSDVFNKALEDAKNIDPAFTTTLSAMTTKSFYNDLGVDISSLQTQYIIFIGSIMVGLTAVIAVVSIIVALYASKIGAKIAKKLRRDLFKKIQNFSHAEFDRFSTASLITRTTNDITQIQLMIIFGIRIICYAPILGIGGIILAINESLSMSWIIAISVVLLLVLVWITFSSTLPKYNKLQKLTDKLNLITRENISGTMVIRAFGTQKYEEDRFDKSNKDLSNVNFFINLVMAVLFPAMSIFMNLLCVLIIWVGANYINNGDVQLGNMMAFMQYVMMIVMSFLMVSIMFIFVPRASVSALRVNEVLQQKSSILDPENPKHFKKFDRGVVEFKSVSFKYGNADEYALSNISFVAKPGETTAFIGSTGSGKSTLVNLVPRFYDVNEGQVLVNGIDVRDVPQKELRDIVGFVPQKGILFSGDIASNLRYGNEKATDEELKEAARIAQAIPFIEEKKKNFHSEISQGGSNVSGGQKQRLCIARALVKKAPIYIFDDSFSALDFKTDAMLRKELIPYTKDSAVLIVAQRVSTIINADKIIVLNDGKVMGMGTHKELLKNCETYREIASSQLTKEDLEK